MARAGLTKQAVVDAALRQLQDGGLDAFSVRGLAKALGVTSPTLHWHIASRADLLDEVADRIVLAGQMGPPRPGESWQDWVGRRARGYRDAILAHRDGARIVAGAGRLSGALAHLEDELRALTDAGFRPADALWLITAGAQFVLGHTLQVQSRPRTAPPPPGGFALPPCTAGAFREAAQAPPDAGFERGLAMIIAGAEQLCFR